MKYTFTSESVTEGHPDKLCDQVSDAILDEILRFDKNSKVAVETFAANGLLVVAGEVSTKNYVDVQKIARNVIKNIGYTSPEYGVDYDHVGIMVSLNEQSSDIAQGVNKKDVQTQGAGDQGLMFGYACNETKELMPLPIMLAHKLTKKLSEVRKNGTLKYLRPDGKSQVAVVYENNQPVYLENVVISAQHDPAINLNKLRQDIQKYVIEPVCKKYINSKTKFFINMTGRFVIGGPQGDTGLTGRKIIVDTYGGYARHGGGAFSGKDPTKVDRSASYAARYVAKNIVAAGLARKCEVQLAYAIGIAKPISVSVDTFGTGVITDKQIVNIINKHFDLRPAAIIKLLDLRRPIYKQVAAYGHFGRTDLELSWEKTDKVELLKKEIMSAASI